MYKTIKKIVSIIMTLLLIISNIFCTTQFPVMAALLTKNDISSDIVTNLTVNPTNINDGENVEVNLSFNGNKAGQPKNIKDGDTIHVNWTKGNEIFFEGFVTSFDLTSNGQVIATANIQKDKAVITFNENVNNLEDVIGNAKFTLQGRNITETNEVHIGTAEVSCGNKLSSVQITKPESGEQSVFYYKAGDMWTNDISHVNWWLNINVPKNTVEKEVIVHDDIQDGHKLDPSTIEIEIVNSVKKIYKGDSVISDFMNDFPGSEIKVTEKSIDINLPKDTVDNNFISFFYKTKITYMNQATFDNHSTAIYQESGKEQILYNSDSSVNNINYGGDITHTVRGELKIFKVTDDSKAPIPNVSFILKKKDGSVIKDGKTEITLTTNEKGIANVKGLSEGQYIVKEISAPNWIEFNPQTTKDLTFEVKKTDSKGTLLTIENSVKTLSIPVEKKWVGKAGNNAKIKLLANGSEVKSVILNNDNNWKHTFTDIPKYDPTTGEKIRYTLSEVAVDGYDTVITGDSDLGFTVTNTITGKVSVGATKIWVGKAGDSVTVNLLADGKKVDSHVLNENNKWQYTFTNLEKYNNGREIVYSISEDKVDGYNTEISGNINDGFVIKNTNIEKLSIPVEKKWVGKAGNNAKIKLLANGSEVKSVILNDDNNWKHTFTDMPKYDPTTGEKIRYTLSEVAVDGYDTVITGDSDLGFTVTNTITGKVSVGATKIWVGKAGDSVTVNLLADGKKVDSHVLNENNKWQYTFTNLEKYNNGREIVYSISEDKVDGYNTEISGNINYGFVIKNTNIEKLSIPVEKKWVGKAGNNAKIKLLANGSEVKSVILNNDNNWKHTFTDIPKYDPTTGEKIRYTLSEVAVDGYDTVITGDSDLGFTVTNTITGKVSVGATKIWVGKAGDSVTVNLLADGKKVDSHVLNENNKWQYTFTNLEKYNNGREIVYSISEDKVDGYNTEISGNMNDGFVIKNIEIVSNTTDTPTTGDSTSLLGYSIILAFSAICIYLIYRKNKKETKK